MYGEGRETAKEARLEKENMMRMTGTKKMMRKLKREGEGRRRSRRRTRSTTMTSVPAKLNILSVT